MAHLVAMRGNFCLRGILAAGAIAVVAAWSGPVWGQEEPPAEEPVQQQPEVAPDEGQALQPDAPEAPDAPDPDAPEAPDEPDAVVHPEMVDEQVTSPSPMEPVQEGLRTPGRDVGERSSLAQEVDTEEPVEFDFENVPLNQVIKSVGQMTGLNFDIDENIQTPVTIISHSPIPADRVYEVLESVLKSRGFSMVPAVEGHLIKVVPTGEMSEAYPYYYGREEAPEGFDRFSTHVVPVRHANAEEIATLLTNLGSDNARVDVYAPTNTLIITDVANGVRNMLDFLEQVDQPGYETETEMFVLEYTRAETVAQQVQEVLIGPEGGEPAARSGDGGSERPTAAQQAAARRRAMIPGEDEAVVVGTRQQTLRIVPDERQNALIVVATEGIMEQVRDLIDRLDAPTPYEANNLHVYELMNSDAEAVAEALNNMIGNVAGGEEEAEAGPSGGLRAFERQVSIATYEQTNALLITASPQDYKLVEHLISQLDTPQRQVYVEVIIMEVVINDNFELAVESAALDESDFFALSNVVDLANVMSQGPLAMTGTGFTGGWIEGTTEVTVPDGQGGSVTQEIPNIPLLMTALETMTELEVLSQPSLFAVDNEESRILVGQEVPFISGTRPALEDSDFRSSALTRVNREDVGIMLEVTPRVSEGDYVSLEMDVEVSQTVESPVGADPNVVGPTLSKSQVTNRVVVKDGSVAIIGGLISEDTDKATRQTPILGDVPLLGWLFGQRTSARQKRNLVVLVTPHIVHDDRDSDRLTQAKLGEFHRRNVDILFEQGFIKKLRGRHEMRTEYRPSEEMSEQLMRGGQFQRGDMER
ncbi:MAG: type II secretion system secretin GspD [Candidatus Hydrogenedentota bacterium]